MAVTLTGLFQITFSTDRVFELEVPEVKVAVTVLVADMVTVQEPVPEQPPPLQPMKMKPVSGVAVRVTVVPLEKPAEHVVPQVIPGGELVTMPSPVPARTTARASIRAQATLE